MLYEQGGYLFIADIALYARRDKTLCERITSVVNDYCLFEKDNTRFWSKSCLERLSHITEKSVKASQSAHKRWGNNANAMRTHSVGNAIKEKKEEEKKEEIYSETKNVSPTDKIFSFFCNEFERSFGRKYVASFAKDKKIIKDLLKVKAEDDIKSLISEFFSINDEFISKAGYTIGVFKSQINKLGLAYDPYRGQV